MPRALRHTRLTTARTRGKPAPSPHIVFSTAGRGGYIRMAQIPGTPEMESRNCPGGTPKTLNRHNSRLQSWMAMRSFQRHVTRSNRTSERGQFSTFSGRESNCQFDSSLTPGPSFAHNVGCRCPNRQCEGIFDIYVLRTFQWHQEQPNARCFAPCC